MTVLRSGPAKAESDGAKKAKEGFVVIFEHPK